MNELQPDFVLMGKCVAVAMVLWVAILFLFYNNDK